MTWLTIVAGLPGSGKSNWAREQGGRVISSDVIRAARRADGLGDSHDEVRERFFASVEKHLAHDDVIADATNLASHWRDPLYEIAQTAGASCRLVLFANVEQALAANAAREESVPAEGMERLKERFYATLKALPDELGRYDDAVIVLRRRVCESREGD